MAVSLLLVLNLLNPVVTPAIMDAAGITVAGKGIDYVGIFQTLLLFQLLPLVVGLGVRDRSPAWAARWQPRLERTATVLLLVVVVGFGLAKGEVLLELDGRAIIAVLACVTGALLGGFVLGLGAPGMPATLSLTAGIRNGSMALVLIGAWFPDPLSMLTALSVSVTMLPLSLVMVYLLRRFGKALAAPED